MGTRLRMVFLSLIFAAACVKIPIDEACCKLQSIPDLECTTETALGTKDFYESDFPKGDWWEMFKDEQLSYLICQALSCNPSLQAAEERVKQAEAYAKIKKSFLLPTIGFSASADWQYLGKNNFFRAFTPVIPGNIPEYEIDVNLTYEFDFWGRNRNIFRSALSMAKAEEAERQNAILILSTSVAGTYFKLQANLEKLRILKNERKILTKLFQLTKERQDNALDNTTQRLSAEEQLFIINQNVLIAEQMIDLNRHMLHMLIGLGPDACVEIEPISLDTHMDFPLPQNISSNLLARRPDLMAYIWRVEGAALLVGAAKADFYPRINLSALVGFDTVFFSKLFSWGSRTSNVEPALYLPIFTGGRLTANLRQRQAEFNELIYSYNNTVLRAVKEVADEIVSLQIASEDLAIEKMLVANKIQNRKIMAQRYVNAIANLLDFLRVQDEVFQQEFKKIEVEYKRLISAVQLIKALGGGYCSAEVPFECR